MFQVFRSSLFLAGCIAASTLVSAVAMGGDLFPPAGPPSSTMKRLDQVSSSKCISSLPYQITEPGNYELCGSLTGVSGQNGITVSSSDVVIDLRGFSLTGVPESRSCILLDKGFTNLTVRGGSISNWEVSGVSALSDSGGAVYLDSLSVSSCGSGISLSSGEVSNTRVSGCAGDGIQVTCPLGSCSTGSVSFSNVTCVRNAGDGFSVTDAGPVLIDSCVSSENGGHGVYILYDGSSKKIAAQDYNSSRSNNSSCVDNGGGGFVVEARNAVEASISFDGCVSTLNAEAGFSSVCTPDDDVSVSLRRCESSGNTREGVRCVDSQVHISDSSCVDNSSHGIWLTTSAAPVTKAQDYNSSRSNTTSAVDTSGNGGDGILVEVELALSDPGTGPFAVSSFRCSDSSSTENTGNGLHLMGNVLAQLDRCVSSSNGDAGLRMSTSSYGGGLSKADSKRCAFSSNTGGGVVCPDANGTVEISLSETEVSRCGTKGVQVTAGSSATEMVLDLDRCVVRHCGEEGVEFDATFSGGDPCPSSFSLRDSSISSNTGTGVVCKCIDGSCRSSSVSGNGDGGMVCGNTGHFLFSSSSFHGNTGTGLDVTCPITELSEVSCSSNTGDGAVLSSSSFRVSSCVFSSNKGQGLHCPSGSGSVRSCVVSSNTVCGVRIDGSGVDISDNLVSGHNNASADCPGISVYGTGNRVRGNMTSGNDNGVALYANGNPVYQGNSSEGENPLFEDAGVSGNSGGTSSITTATSSFTNIVH